MRKERIFVFYIWFWVAKIEVDTTLIVHYGKKEQASLDVAQVTHQKRDKNERNI